MRRIFERKGFDSHGLLIKPDGYVVNSFYCGERRGKYRIGSDFRIARRHPLLTRSFEPLHLERFLAQIPFKYSSINWQSKCMAALDSRRQRIAAFFLDDYPVKNDDQLSLF
ncbi:MAG: hypothetical protein AAFW95_01950 [Cyanobacteria bacterium J06638_6]